MKKDIHIEARFDQPELLNNLVERLALKRSDIAYGDLSMSHNRQFIETSSTETYVSGTLALSIHSLKPGDCINMPFITSFLFTCLRENDGLYKIAWSISLS